MAADPGAARTRPRIFVSYRRNDAPGHAGRVHDALAHHFGSQHIFMDIDDIPAGTVFAYVLDRALAECDILLALIGPRWLTLAAGSAAGGWMTRKILSVSRSPPHLSAESRRPGAVQDARMPTALQLPNPLWGSPISRRPSCPTGGGAPTSAG